VQDVGDTAPPEPRPVADSAIRAEALYRALDELRAVLDAVPAAVWIARDRECTRIDANRIGAEVLRTPQGSNVSVTGPSGERPTNFRALQDGKAVRPEDFAMQVAARTGKTLHGVEQSILFDDGTVRHLLGNAIPLVGNDGLPRGAVGAFVDITGRKRAEQALEAAQQRLATDLDAMTRLHRLSTSFVREDLAAVLEEVVATAIAITGADMGNLQLLDRSTGRLNIVAHRGHEKWWMDFFSSVADGKGASCGAALEQRTRVVVEDVTTSPVFVGTAALDVQLRAGVRAAQSTPLVSSSGAVVGMISTHWRKPHRPDEQALRFLDLLARQTADMVERTRTQEALGASEARLRLALGAARMIAWEYDPATKRVTLTENVPEVLALPSGRIHRNSDEGYGLIHPDDVEAHRALVDDAVANAGSYVSVYRQVGDGEVVWLEERGRALTDESGRTVRLVGITQNITERKRAEEALRVANDRPLETDRRKDEFIAVLGHELRNPLAPLRNAAHILERADPVSEQAARARGVLRRQSEHLARLVDDLLDVARISRGRISLERSQFDLCDTVVRAAEDFRVAIAARGIAFRMELPKSAIWMDADITRVDQVVTNLVHNAAKFTPSGGEIVLSLRGENGLAELRVRDTGAGIDPAVLPTLFQPFVQGERTLARSEGGLGLGLALVKGIVDLHGGEIRAESAGLGKGAEFVVWLPARVAFTGPSGGGTRERPAAEARRVLVVDDHRDAAETLADLLRLQGHLVEVAFDGVSALAALETASPDVVLCDIGLPGMSGYELARAIRARNRPGVQLIAISGYAQAEDVRRALEAGFDAHVAKPPDPDELERLLSGEVVAKGSVPKVRGW